jgi:two-component system invasion response regulator UvrY
LLSSREFEILTLILHGKTNKDISNQINLSASTVSTHKSRIFEKLNVLSDVELSQMASNYGITSL